MLRLAVLALAVVMPLAVVAPADAANVVSRDGTVLRAEATDQLQLSVARSGATITFGSSISFTESESTCSKPDTFTVTCTQAGQITRIDLVTSPLGDFLSVGALDIPLVWLAGEGDDVSNIFGSGGATARSEIRGQGGSDFLRGNVGPDLIDGGPGNDRLDFGNGDEVFGGPDSDSLDNISAFPAALNATLDDVADDGFGATRTGNLHADIEEVRGDSTADVITGSAGPNEIVGFGGNDVIDGRGGHDHLSGDEGNDTLRARDGLAERVDCGPGDDTAEVDDIDVPVDCENVSVSDQVRPDVDADGARKPGDCNDNNAGIRPGAVDVPENGVDEDCNGADAVVLDRDGDGVPRPQDCNDTRTDVRPGAREILGNKVDEDCNGEADPFRVLPVRLSQRTLAFATFTTVERLRLSRVRRGQRVRLRCTGGGCKFKSRSVRVRKRGKLNLTKRLDGTRLRGGAKLTVRVTARNGVAKQFAFTFRRGAAPIFLIRCREPGTGLRRCQS